MGTRGARDVGTGGGGARGVRRERDDARAAFEDRREEIRNQHGEDVSTMKMMYEHKIEELERELAQ